MNAIMKVIPKIKLEPMMTPTTRMAPTMMEMIVAIHPKKRTNTVAMTMIAAMTVTVVIIVKNILVPMVANIAGMNVVAKIAQINGVIIMMNCQMMMMELLKMMNRLMMTVYINCPIVVTVTMMMKAVALAMI